MKIGKLLYIVMALTLFTLALPAAAGATDVNIADSNIATADLNIADSINIADSSTPDSKDTQSIDYAIPEIIDGYPVPKEIGGYQVIFVEWSENSPYLPSGIVRLTLRANSDDSKVSGQDQDLFDAIRKLPEGWIVGVVGGAGFSFDQMLANHEKQNEDYIKYGPLPKSGGPGPDGPTDISPQMSDTKAVTVSGPPRSVALDQNKDPQTKDLYEQDVRLYAPVVGPAQGQNSVFSMQINTNADGFLQAGLLFANDDHGYVVWTTQNILNCLLMPFEPAILYVSGHVYRFAIYNQWPHSGANWAIEVLDGDLWSQQLVNWEPGTKLKYSWNTSVWFENMNTNAGWYSGFTNPIWANYAEEEDYYGLITKWSSDSKTVYIVHPNGSTEVKPNNGIITGSLVNYGYAYWYLNKVLLAPTS